MTIQFNLLPDIKVQYLKAKRQKHLVVLASVSASVVALAVFVILLTTVFVLQKKNIADLNKDIKSSSTQLQNVEDLDKILTVQNQLNSLPALHSDKVVASRLADYLIQVTPATISISKLSIDYEANTMTIAGSTGDLTAVNIFTDTLKFTKFKTKDNSEEKLAFSKVVLASFARDEKSATYELGFEFDPTIFSNSEEVSLVVPQIVTTRSEVAKPTELFQTGGGQ
jgi:Tfp pilus assembly protein PilN